MKTNEWLALTTKKLQEAGIVTPRLDALILLEDTLNIDRSQLLIDDETKIESATLQVLKKQVARRLKHEPLAYIRSKTEFYGREFIINRYVLQPRPESETMIDLLKKLTSQISPTIIDIGTGSGVLAISAKIEIPGSKVIATDIDLKCLDLATKNALKYGLDIKFLHGDMLEPFKTKWQMIDKAIILANLPYVPSQYKINKAATHEPRKAIFGGEDGLELYRHLFNGLNGTKNKGQVIYTESLPYQHKYLLRIAQKAGYRLLDSDDFIQVFAN